MWQKAVAIARKQGGGPTVAARPAVAPPPPAPAPGDLAIPDWTPGDAPPPPPPGYTNWPLTGPAIKGRPAPTPAQAPGLPDWMKNLGTGQPQPQPRKPAPKPAPKPEPKKPSLEEQWRDFMKTLPRSEGHLPKLEGKTLVNALELAKRAAAEGKLRPDQVEKLKGLLHGKQLGQSLTIDPEEWEKSHSIDKALRAEPVYRYEQGTAEGGVVERALRTAMGDKLYGTADESARKYQPRGVDWTNLVSGGWGLHAMHNDDLKAQNAEGVGPVRGALRETMGMNNWDFPPSYEPYTAASGIRESGNASDALNVAHSQAGGAIPLTGPPGAGAAEAAYQGPIRSHVPGRTDRLNIDVDPGAYVLPADSVSIAGQGNTEAGYNVFKLMMSVPPAKGRPMRGAPGAPGLNLRPHIMKAPTHGKGNAWRGGVRYANGGKVWVNPKEVPIQPNEERDQGLVPIIAAGGEIVIPPHLIEAKFGDLDRGHEILDGLVLRMRADEIKRLKTTPPPKK